MIILMLLQITFSFEIYVTLDAFEWLPLCVGSFMHLRIIYACKAFVTLCTYGFSPVWVLTCNNMKYKNVFIFF